jgi:hypothetical protein
MGENKESRKHPRHPLDGRLKVSWQDAGGRTHESIGRIVDASESGFRVVMPDRLESRSYVHLRVDRYGFKAMACVRYSVRKGITYSAGLEFSGGVRFPLPQFSEEAVA